MCYKNVMLVLVSAPIQQKGYETKPAGRKTGRVLRSKP